MLFVTLIAILEQNNNLQIIYKKITIGIFLVFPLNFSFQMNPLKPMSHNTNLRLYPEIIMKLLVTLQQCARALVYNKNLVIYLEANFHN